MRMAPGSIASRRATAISTRRRGSHLGTGRDSATPRESRIRRRAGVRSGTPDPTTRTRHRVSMDFHDEVARELQASYAELAGGRARVEALEELERLSLELAAELRRPLTVFDVIRAAPDAGERARRMELVQVLRRPA